MSKQFSKINPDTNEVLTILVADDANYLFGNFGGTWVEIKEYHNQPTPGYTWDPNIDNFYAPKPYPSFVLNKETAIWESPVPSPNDGKLRQWSERYQAWVTPEPMPFRRGDEPPLSSEKQDDEFVYEYNFTKKTWEKIEFSYDPDTDTWTKSIV